ERIDPPPGSAVDTRDHGQGDDDDSLHPCLDGQENAAIDESRDEGGDDDDDDDRGDPGAEEVRNDFAQQHPEGDPDGEFGDFTDLAVGAEPQAHPGGYRGE